MTKPTEALPPRFRSERTAALDWTGYILMAVAVAAHSDIVLQALLFYLAAYAAANLGAVAVAAEFPNARTLGDYAGLAGRHPWLR